jgi:hypothetical protein
MAGSKINIASSMAWALRKVILNEAQQWAKPLCRILTRLAAVEAGNGEPALFGQQAAQLQYELLLQLKADGKNQSIFILRQS